MQSTEGCPVVFQYYAPKLHLSIILSRHATML